MTKAPQATSIRQYAPYECVVFRKTNEEFGGLSNMAPGFPILLGEVRIRTTEALYQACRFPHLPDVQRMILGEVSPMTAKMRSKAHRDETRRDWDHVRVNLMRWCLRLKLAQHWKVFGALLEKTGDRPIVEFSRKDPFWGAKPSDTGLLIGKNALGRLLMELRQAYLGADREALRIVRAPVIPNALLLGQRIDTVDTREPPNSVLQPTAGVYPRRG